MRLSKSWIGLWTEAWVTKSLCLASAVARKVTLPRRRFPCSDVLNVISLSRRCPDRGGLERDAPKQSGLPSVRLVSLHDHRATIDRDVRNRQRPRPGPRCNFSKAFFRRATDWTRAGAIGSPLRSRWREPGEKSR